MPTPNAEKSAVVTHNSPAELWDIGLKVNQVLRLLKCYHIVEMNVLVAPLEIMDDAFVCEFLLDDENVLKELSDSLINVKVVEFCDHGLLVFKVLFVLINQSMSFVDY